MSSCEQHDAFQAAAAVVTAAEAEQREAEEEQEAGGETIAVRSDGDESEEGDGDADAQDQGGTGSTARLRGKRMRKEPDRHDPNREASRPQRATAKKKHQTRNAAGYRDNDVDAVFRAEVEKFTSSLAAELARR